jgi:hypothetical protein
MKKPESLLSGGDLRSIGKSNSLISKINTQEKFDDLFKSLFNKDRIVVMRAADVVEKITLKSPSYLKKHKNKILELCMIATDKELKWHLAQLLPRIKLNKSELSLVWNTISEWAANKAESKIVRVNSIQSMFELSEGNDSLRKKLENTISEIKKENVPSLNARIKKLASK